jgi:hypothetical protein
MDNVVMQGWALTGDPSNGYSATYYRNSVGLVAIWQPEWAMLLAKLTGYDEKGNKL